MTPPGTTKILEIFLAECGKDEPSIPIDLKDLARWSKELDIGESDLLNSISLELARAYHRGDYSYLKCDEVANYLWWLALHWSSAAYKRPLPDLVCDVYEAFDAGEYHRCPNNTDDPVAEYTDRLVAEIVANMADSNDLVPRRQTSRVSGVPPSRAGHPEPPSNRRNPP